MARTDTGRTITDPFTAGRRYPIIYADPPWRYRDEAHAGRRGVRFKYGLLGNEAIAALPVSRIAADDAMLFLWVTWPKLPEVLPIIEAWGFRYRTCAFLWVKRTRNGEKLLWGMGSYTRANTEPCLLATRGRPRRVSAGVHQVVDAPIGRHSEKPAVVRERIVALAGDVPRIELFARERAPGWDAWGDDPALLAATVQADTPTPPAVTIPAATRGNGAGAHGERVLEHLARHGAIRRREVEALCGVDAAEAKRVLAALVAGGLIRRSGRGRGARYTPAG